MNTTAKLLIIAALAVAVVVAVALKRGIPASGNAVATATSAPVAQAKLPRLVDLGAGKCIPCKKMVPILEGLRMDYAGRLEVVFVDVWENPEAAKPYHINLIPTQIFYDAEGGELFRHEGFMGREDILAKWKELGVNLDIPQ